MKRLTCFLAALALMLWLSTIPAAGGPHGGPSHGGGMHSHPGISYRPPSHYSRPGLPSSWPSHPGIWPSYPDHPPQHSYHYYGPGGYWGPGWGYGYYYPPYWSYGYPVPVTRTYNYYYDTAPYTSDSGMSITVDWSAYDTNATYRQHVNDMMSQGWQIRNPR